MGLPGQNPVLYFAPPTLLTCTRPPLDIRSKDTMPKDTLPRFRHPPFLLAFRGFLNGGGDATRFFARWAGA